MWFPPVTTLLRNMSETILSELRMFPTPSGYAHRTSKMSGFASEALIQTKTTCGSSNILHQSPLASIPQFSRKPNLAVPPRQIRQYTTTESTHPPSPPHEDPDSKVISDHEYNIRLGRAVYTLETTLPDFFQTGLVPMATLNDESSTSGSKREDDNKPLEDKKVPESIYASNIRLSYTPPAAFGLPAAFPRTLQVEGLPFYHASAAFIRHTLSAFNTDLQLNLCKFTVRSLSPRNRQIEIRTILSGRSRLSGALNEWDVYSTYTLSPQTGLIDVHVVDSIQPAPHMTFLDGLRGTLARLAGLDLERRPATNGLHTQSKSS